MGFGILFLSHLLLFFCKGVDVFPDAAAYAVMACALYRLKPYAPGFAMALKAVCAVLPLSLINDGLQIASALGAGIPAAVSGAATAATSLGMVAVYWLTLIGVEYLSKDVGRPKIAARAVKCRILTVVYIAAMTVCRFDLPFMRDFNRYMGIIYLFLGLGWVILVGTTYYSCYMWICLEGDEDMPESNKGALDRLLSGLRSDKAPAPDETEEIPSAAPREKAGKKKKKK